MSNLDPGPFDDLSPEREMFAPPEGYGDLATRSFAAGRGVLAARRAFRGALFVLSLTAAFAAGLGAGRSRSGASPEKALESETRSVDSSGEGGSSGAAFESVEPDVFAVESRAAEAGLADRVRLLIRAGDRYLAERRDVEAAARCYRDALAAAEAAGLERPEARGNWLATAIFAEEP